jgi:hypothetical protein
MLVSAGTPMSCARLSLVELAATRWIEPLDATPQDAGATTDDQHALPA